MAAKKVTKAAEEKKTTKKVATAKKTATKKTATKKTATKKAATKTAATSTEKKVAKKVAKKTAVKKTATKKTAAKKTAAKKVRKRRDPLAGTPAAQELNIADAITKKPKKLKSKSGQVIARRDATKIQEEKIDLTMEEYRPSHKSLLDSEDNIGPVYRYSDDDLQEFKEILLERLEKAKTDLAYFQGLITRKDDSGTSDTDNRFNHMEDGSAAMEREQVSQLAARQAQFIQHLENALVRIENKTYGICRVTKKLISKERLRAVPHATLSIEAKRDMR